MEFNLTVLDEHDNLVDTHTFRDGPGDEPSDCVGLVLLHLPDGVWQSMPVQGAVVITRVR